MHSNNLHNCGYDFDRLSKGTPELMSYVFVNEYKTKTIDFSDAAAVKTLNKALLQCYYRVDHWDIPDGYLCPPIPGRADYIHYLHDLLQSSFQGVYKKVADNADVKKLVLDKNVRALDIGTGASCIYPILGQRCYQWQFIASDIDPVSINVAKNICQSNKGLASSIDCRIQKDANKYFDNILKINEPIDVVLCNPPFHESLAAADQGSKRKWKNLGKAPKNALNFGGQKAELWCEGGELVFVTKMIKESKQYHSQVFWFTSLISKNSHINPLKKILTQMQATEIKVVEMQQGQKTSRFIAWSFLSKTEQFKWIKDYYLS